MFSTHKVDRDGFGAVLPQEFVVGADGGLQDLAHFGGFPRSRPPRQDLRGAADVGSSAGQRLGDKRRPVDRQGSAVRVGFPVT
jgi:hypothetical protein